MAAGEGGPACAMAMRIVAETGRMLGADRLIPVASVHVDGCLYHGDSGTAFAERLVAGGGAVRVPTTLTLLGYPALATLLFIAAAIGGVWLLITIMRSDR